MSLQLVEGCLRLLQQGAGLVGFTGDRDDDVIRKIGGGVRLESRSELRADCLSVLHLHQPSDCLSQVTVSFVMELRFA